MTGKMICKEWLPERVLIKLKGSWQNHYIRQKGEVKFICPSTKSKIIARQKKVYTQILELKNYRGQWIVDLSHFLGKESKYSEL